MTVSFKNEFLSIEVDSCGAELSSVKSAKQGEYMWHRDKEIWDSNAPVLFPIVGGLREDKYTLNGTEYTLTKHGFARGAEFELEKQAENGATLLLRSTEKTLAQFPYDLEFRVVFLLEEDKLRISYITDNKTDREMFFSVGAHEGYACPNGIEDYYLEFEHAETADRHLVDGNLLDYTAEKVMENTNILELRPNDYERDAIIFQGIKSRAVTLKHKHSDKTIRVDFDGFDYLGIWTKVGAKFLCIEPWCGIPDYIDSDFDITKKKGILKLAPNSSMEKVHTITFG